jgi:phosphomannomutase
VTANNKKSTTRKGLRSDYEAIHRNRLIALLGVIFARQSPGSTVVTCSVTSEGLSRFLEHDLGLHHVRHVKGYANVIGRARYLTESGLANAEVAIETSGHCALRENDYLDDGTYTAVKKIGLLAREKSKDPTNASLLRLIDGMREMEEVVEIRMRPKDGTLESTARLFDYAALEIEAACSSSCDGGDGGNDGEEDAASDAMLPLPLLPDWKLDSHNLEGYPRQGGN